MWGYQLWRFIYPWVAPILLVPMLPGALLRMFRRGRASHRIADRWGLYRYADMEHFQGEQPIWIHAVSVGEVLLAKKFIDSWCTMPGHSPIFLTTTTVTGFQQVEEQLPPGVVLGYYPVDLTWCVNVALNRVRPRLIAFIEAAPWPGLQLAAKQRAIPVGILNARVSPRSQKRYRSLQWLVAPLIRHLSFVTTTDEADTTFWQEMGAPRVLNLGNMKFDLGEPDENRIEASKSLLKAIGWTDKTILLGGSTWEGEEEALIRIYQKLRIDHATLRLILVPRHVERCRRIMEQSPVPMLRRSAVTSEVHDPEILLVDTTGELRWLYYCAHLIFVGKSLFEYGGQNPVEPAVTGRPVFCGPHMENFRVVIEQLKAEQAITQVADADALLVVMSAALEQPKETSAASAVLAQHQRAVERHRDFVIRKDPSF